MTATLQQRPPTRPERASPRLLLASRSPRRRELLRDASIPHGTIDPQVDDGQLAPGDVPPTAWVAALSYLKARAAWERLAESERAGVIVLGADTIVEKQGRIIGQSVDAADAERTIGVLEGGSHRVLTGVTLLARALPLDELAAMGFGVETGCDAAGAQRAGLVDSARVTVGALGPERVRGYLATGGWRGKAGAYNLSERLAEGWPIQYEGDPGTIMGLPMRRLVPALRRLLELDPA